MNEWRERYWLLKQGCRGHAAEERRAEDFVCCEVPIGEATALALAVFTSQKSAKAELRGMERLASDKYCPRAANKHQEKLAEGESDKTLSDRIAEFAGYELVEMLDDSDIPYVMIDSPPVDKPISEDLWIELASVFVEEQRRLLLGTMKKGRA